MTTIKTFYFKIFFFCYNHPTKTKVIFFLILYLSFYLIVLKKPVYAEGWKFYVEPSPHTPSTPYISQEDYQWVKRQAMAIQFNPSPPAEIDDKTPDLSSTSSENGDDSNENTLPEFSAQEIMDTYHVLLENCKTKEDIALQSIEFVKVMIPKELWATSPEELSSANANINKYIDNLGKNIELNTQDDLICFINLKASISTYNAALLHNVYDNKELLVKIHYQTVEKILELDFS